MNYTASDFGGVILIQASPAGQSSASGGQAGINVGSLLGLVRLADNPSLYTKIGGTLEHPGPCFSGTTGCDSSGYAQGYDGIDLNHFGDSAFLNKIVSITTAFKAEFPSETVLINDASQG